MAFNKNAEDTLLLSLWPIKGCINGKNHGNQNSLDLSFCVSMFSPSLYKGRRNYFPIKKGWDLEFHRIPSFKVSESCFWILSGHERLGTVQVCGVGRVAGWLFLIFLTTMVAHCSLQFLVAVWFLREDKQDLIGRGDYMLQIGGDETWCSKCWLFWLISPFKNCPLVFLGRLISYFMTPDFFLQNSEVCLPDSSPQKMINIFAGWAFQGEIRDPSECLPDFFLDDSRPGLMQAGSHRRAWQCVEELPLVQSLRRKAGVGWLDSNSVGMFFRCNFLFFVSFCLHPDLWITDTVDFYHLKNLQIHQFDIHSLTPFNSLSSIALKNPINDQTIWWGQNIFDFYDKKISAQKNL